MVNLVSILKTYGIPYIDKGRNITISCPYHEETKASLSIEKERGVFYCFGCGAKGSIYEILAKLLDSDPYSVMQLVKGVGGLEVVHYEPFVMKTSNILDLHKVFRQFSGIANTYLESRGVVSPDIFECGIDVSSNRLTIPVKFEGELVGFESRTLGEDEDKYKAMYFPKFNYLYGWDYLTSNKSIFLVESSISVMYLKNTLKIPNSLALMGTRVSEEQLNLISKLGKNIYIWLDNDRAGNLARLKILKRFPNSYVIYSRVDPDEVKGMNEVEVYKVN